MRLLGLTCTLLALTATKTAPVHAQPDSPTVDECMAYFMAGDAASASGRFADAAENFRRSYQLCGVPQALYNVAVSERALGRYRASCESFGRLRRDHPEMSEEAQSFHDEVCARVGEIALHGIPDDLREFTLRVDGQRVEETLERPIVVPVDPGLHAVTLNHRRYRTFDWDGEVEEGGRAIVDVQLEALPESTTPQREVIDGDEHDPPLEPRRRWYQRAAFWVPVSLVIAGGATMLGLGLYKRGELTVSQNPQYPDRVVNVGEFAP